MKVWVYVEGESDRLALEALWRDWRERLRSGNHGIAVVPLHDKSRFFRKIGPRAAEKLDNNESDLVIGLPDLHPTNVYSNTDFRHDDLEQLQGVQRRLVREKLESIFGYPTAQASHALERFFPSALKHDLEMLLLAAKEELRSVLGTSDALGGWPTAVEEQNQAHPPKHVVKELFLTKSRKKCAYKETRHAPDVLRRVANMRSLVYAQNGQCKCPVFSEMLDWIGSATGISAY